MTEDAQLWREFFLDNGLQAGRTLDGYLAFVERCWKQGVPPIFEERHLSRLIGIDFENLIPLLDDNNARYRSFMLPKRAGGFRKINVPGPTLLAVQQWLLQNILYKIPLSENAHGGVPGRSVVSNARVHLGAACVLRMDLQDFFGSIRMASGATLFKDLGYPYNVARSLAHLCFEEDGLPQGAATSPAMANLITQPLDSRLSGLAKKFDLQYTRYFDDLTFSGRHISLRFSEIVKGIVFESGFLINDNKTILARGKSPKLVTGLSVGGRILRVPRSYRRAVKNQAFLLLKRGAEVHSQIAGFRSPLIVERTLGKVAFWLHVEPESKVAKSLFTSVNEYRRQYVSSVHLPKPVRAVPFAIGDDPFSMPTV